MFGEDGRNLSSRNTVLKFTVSPSFIGSCVKKIQFVLKQTD